ncbi:MAG TPA: aldo/keto reductase [Candidatus Eisenbacteria bacterium]|nr:aldo/keto reductase [Candidatus Eisenbacteria bacterium]
MQTRAIGSLRVSIVGIGCNNFGRRIDAAATDEVVHAALDAGINFFDTADIYGDGHSEEFLGHALGARRSEALIATKFGSAYSGGAGGAKPDYIRNAVEDSLRRLGTDRIDLYQLHKPDPVTPIGETLAALNALVSAGKVREIGCSNFSVGQLREARAAAAPGAARFVSVQNEYSLIQREPEQGVLAECEREGLAFLPYFPLASGLLSGKYRKGEPAPQGTRLAGSPRAGEILTDPHLDMVEALAAFARARGHSVLELAIAWLLSRRPVASVIAGATKPEQVRANAAAAAWTLTPVELIDVDAILHQHA